MGLFQPLLLLYHPAYRIQQNPKNYRKIFNSLPRSILIFLLSCNEGHSLSCYTI